MKTLIFSLVTMTMSLSAHALEVGDATPCVVLNQIASNGSEREACIREPNAQGQVKVLEFFSAFCSDCAKNLPKFSSLHSKFGSQATFRLVGVDRSEKALRDYVANHKNLILFETALDTNREALRAFEVTATPTIFVLDAEDRIVYKHVGVLGSQDIEELSKVIETRK